MGIENYQAVILRKLQLIQQIWLASATPSRSIISLCLQSTNKVLVESACSTNKSTNLGKPCEARPSYLSRKIKKSQASLLKRHQNLRKFNGPQDDLINLKEKFKNYKTKHRKLIRSENASESIQRDTNLFKILEKNPSKVFSVIRAGKRDNSRKIDKLNLCW